jgi:hypothetical protein
MFCRAVIRGSSWKSWKMKPTRSRRSRVRALVPQAAEVDAADGDAAGVRAVESGEQLQEGGLPRPRGADDDGDLPGFDRQRDIVDGGDGLVTGTEVPGQAGGADRR